MTWPIFPSSPVPANLSREAFWNSQVLQYDSGKSQGDTGWSRPLYRFSIPWVNINETKQNTLEAFVRDRRGNTLPFLFGDPYHNTISSYVFVASVQVTTAYLLDNDGFEVFPASGHIALTSTVSGTMAEGTDFSVNSLTGVITFTNTTLLNESITCDSAFFYKLCRFNGSYRTQSPLWNIFNSNITIEEILP